MFSTITPFRHLNRPGALIFSYLSFLSLACSSGGNSGDISASGTIEATTVNVASKVSGQVKSLKVQEGSVVVTGDTLAEIDHLTLDLQLKQAEAGLELAEAQDQLLVKGAREEDIRQAEEGLTQAEANWKVAEEDKKRMQELFDSHSATQKQRDDAEARSTVALAQYNSAKQGLQKVMQWARPEELRASKARVNQAKASVDLLKKTISDSYIVAPVNGTVTSKSVEVGELVAPGATILTITKLETVNLMIYVTEVELARVKLGQQADVQIDGEPTRSFIGRVTYISPKAEFTPKNIQTKEDRVKLVFGVKVEIDNPDGSLKPGMPADAVIRTASESTR